MEKPSGKAETMQPPLPTSPETARAALARLEKALDDENEALANFNASSIADFSRIKTQCLLELQRPAGMNPAQDPGLQMRLQELQQKLELNRWLLNLHLEAAKEVSSVITAAIRDAESDGTYSRYSGAAKVYG
jgi:hypothetical protein